MTWGRWVRLIGLVLLVIWGTYFVVALSALAGVAAAEHGEVRPYFVTPSPHPGPSWAPR